MIYSDVKYLIENRPSRSLTSSVSSVESISSMNSQSQTPSALEPMAVIGSAYSIEILCQGKKWTRLLAYDFN